MARFTKENVDRARQTMALYPHTRSALIPLLHIAQEQNGYLTKEAMVHVAELLDLTPAEVYGTASFYEMFKFHPVGTYLVNVCTNISCMLVGGYDVLSGLEDKLGVSAGATTPDGAFTLEEVECVAACTDAPCLLVNYRKFGPLTVDEAKNLIDELRDGNLTDVVPPHGVTNRVTTRRFSTSVLPAGAADRGGVPREEDPDTKASPGATAPTSRDESRATQNPRGRGRRG